MPVLEVAELDSDSGQEEQLAKLSGRIAEFVVRQPGVSRCELLRGVEEPARFLLLITWESLQAHAAFRDSEAFAEYDRMVEGLIAATRFAHYQSLAATPG
ncbi:MAG: antibiotic biosynthesis monooxygenase [Acidimicrobiaceae bacterium]|nr:antibiotic biosynthesis monooxygenase [Acidimicrobiaceae bacterium]